MKVKENYTRATNPRVVQHRKRLIRVLNLQQNLQQFGAFRLLLRYCRDSATIISHLLTIINGLLTNTYKTPWRTENPCVGGSIPPLPIR